jgi:hypothetical protein
MIHPRTEEILRAIMRGEDTELAPGLTEFLWQWNKTMRHISQAIFEILPEGDERPEDGGLPYVVDGEPLS